MREYKFFETFPVRDWTESIPVGNGRMGGTLMCGIGEEVMYLIVKSSFELAENSVEELRHERYLDTIDNYYNFISEYPETKFKKDVDKIYKASQKFVKSTKKNNKSEDGNQEERSE